MKLSWLLYVSTNEAPTPPAVVQFQAWVNWYGCDRKDVQCENLGRDVVSHTRLCGCHKPSSCRMMRGEGRRISASNQRPLKIHNFRVLFSSVSRGLSWRRRCGTVVVAVCHRGTIPSSFKLETFVNNLSKPNASTFEKLGM